jgi:hypothetical protein
MSNVKEKIAIDFNGSEGIDYTSEIITRLDHASFLIASGTIDPDERDEMGSTNESKLRLLEKMAENEMRRLYPEIFSWPGQLPGH